MGHVHKELTIAANPDAVWNAIRDTGRIHDRLARGFVVETTLDGDTRTVTFANGFVAKERIIDLNDGARRIAYSASSPRLSHHHASIQAFPDAAGSRVVWIADLLPDEAVRTVESMMNDGCAAMKATLEAASITT